ncbi:transcriptional regulator [Desulfosporosinus acidiphilus SJ4]|uniref:Transcriptional regulator n=1 Tax=Desulfosporosinus acidiphilus (strain DSM 22704 / JCM 16185 / SJ4) TaxID=646529 RepID=I4D2B0_DESAJ|nr:TetR/AcrR family transcriptional regulator [Desulfosporosinus acidiphilus]AFM39934.1 transcriptional regulator [Desulfosporosinus acidiphilus SJ4]
MVYKRSKKTEDRKDERRKLITKTAAKVFAERGYHQTSVKDITDDAEISVGTFYLYFKNKEDIFETLYDEMYKIIANITNYAIYGKEASVAERFSRAAASSAWAHQKYRELAKILLIEAVGLNPRFEKKYAALMQASCKSMESTLEYLKTRGDVDIPDVRVAAIAQEGAFSHVITYWLRNDSNSDLKKYIYPLVVYDLQALKIDFQPNDVQRYIEEIFQELDNGIDKYISFKSLQEKRGGSDG